jgi:hypothetical protein
MWRFVPRGGAGLQACGKDPLKVLALASAGIKRHPILSPYSYLNATVGFTRVARLAGI